MKESTFEPWELEDSQRLLKLWEKHRKETGTNQTKFAKEFNLGSQGNVGHYLHKRQPLNIEAVKNFARGLNCKIEDISPTLAKRIAESAEYINLQESEDFTDVKRFDVQASAGKGRPVFEYDHLEPFKIRTDFLSSQGGNQKNTFFMQVKGDSMEPTIPDGSDVLVVEAHDEIINGKIYVFFLNREIYIKTLNKTDAGIMATSDNRDYDPIFISKKDDFMLLGRVVMCSYKL